MTRRKLTNCSSINVGSEYEDDEAELLRAVDKYRTAHGKAFLTAVEVLRVILDLGYRKVEPAPRRNSDRPRARR